MRQWLRSDARGTAAENSGRQRAQITSLKPFTASVLIAISAGAASATGLSDNKKPARAGFFDGRLRSVQTGWHWKNQSMEKKPGCAVFTPLAGQNDPGRLQSPGSRPTMKPLRTQLKRQCCGNRLTDHFVKMSFPRRVACSRYTEPLCAMATVLRPCSRSLL